MRDLDRLDRRFGLGADPRQHPGRVARRGPFRLWREAVAGFVCLAVVAAVVGVQLYDLRGPSGAGRYAFEQTQPHSHRPVGYDPCLTIHYVVNPDNGPADYLAFIQRAVTEASRSSGIRFEYDGTTTDRDFDRITGPVLIGFANTDEVSELSGEDVVGAGGSVAVGPPGRRRYFHSGMVALKPSWFADEDAHHRQDAEEAVVMHELGHVLGLAHVQDKHELMYPSLTRTTYGRGDIEGLAVLGAIPCE